MRARLLVLGMVGIVVCTALLSGCSVETCSGASIPPPSVMLDATQWRLAHPDATLRACLDGGDCVTVHYSAQVAAKVAVGKEASFELRISGAENGTLRG